jgi:hypothetical protein
MSTRSVSAPFSVRNFHLARVGTSTVGVPSVRLRSAVAPSALFHCVITWFLISSGSKSRDFLGTGADNRTVALKLLNYTVPVSACLLSDSVVL